MKVSPSLIIILLMISFPACNMRKEQAHKVVIGHPQSKTVTLTEQYVCQIKAQLHIKIRALGKGYLSAIQIRDGQQVKQGDPLFKVIPILCQQRADAASAEASLAERHYKYVQKVIEDKVWIGGESPYLELKSLAAKLAKAQADDQLASAELNSVATTNAPFDGLIDGLSRQQGSLVQEGETLATLSDSSMLWVYFDVPESHFLELMDSRNQHNEDPQIELLLANGDKFEHNGKLGAVLPNCFNTQSDKVCFRADFPNPRRLLCHGQTGAVLIRRVQRSAIFVPRRATYQVHDKWYVDVVDQDSVAHHREITIQRELDDVFVIRAGVGVEDKIVLEGFGNLRDGEKVECDQRMPFQTRTKPK